MQSKSLRGAVVPACALVFVAAACTLESSDEDVGKNAGELANTPEARERCATRLAIAFTGQSASGPQLASADPQAAVDGFLTAPTFIERFASFLNARLNPEPGEAIGDDSAYHLARYVLQNKRPYADMFVGPYTLDASGAVSADPNGLGYFRSRPWMVRYAGNESAGYRLVSAYRILQNTTGIVLFATTNVAGVDLTAAGRMAPACAGCHYNGWFALDKVARVLSKRKGTGATMTFTAPAAADVPQQILGNQTIASDKELVTALVASDHFKFNTCRHVFNFLYGRDETTAETALFDRCVDAFTSQGTIQAGLAAVAKDPSFCE
jgi:hypothetical protein